MVQKIVKKEYLVNTLISLVGNVGGTLGMFVGISMFGVTQRLQDFVLPPLFGCIKKCYLRARVKSLDQLHV